MVLVWPKSCDLYDMQSAATHVYWLKKLIHLRMKEGISMSHLNEFNTIFSQLTTQKIMFNDSIKAVFLLVTLSKSWDTFRTAISNSAFMDGLTCVDVESSLLIEQVNQKNVDANKSSNALTIRGRSQARRKSREREIV